jgi:hypothetical protein
MFSCGKMLPISLLKNGFLSLEYQLESPSRALILALGGSIPGYSITNAAYMAKIVRVEDTEIMSKMWTMMLSNQIKFHTSTYQTHVFSQVLPVGSEYRCSLNIPDRSSSLKSIYAMVIEQNPKVNGSNLQSGKCKMASYQFNIGGNLTPNRAIKISDKNMGESFAEYKRSYNNLMNMDLKTNTNPDIYGRDNVNDGGAAFKGSFCASYCFESFPHDSVVSESGFNSSSLSIPISLDLVFNAQTTAKNVMIVVYCYRDVIYSLDENSTFNVMA